MAQHQGRAHRQPALGHVHVRAAQARHRHLDDDVVLARRHRPRYLAQPHRAFVLDQSPHLAFGSFGFIAEKLGWSHLVGDAEPDGIGCCFTRTGPALARLGLLLRHGCGEAVLINGNAAHAQGVGRQVERKAIGIIKLEGRGTGKDVALAHRPSFVGQDLQTAPERLQEASFLQAHRFSNHRLAARKLGIGLAHLPHQGRHQLVDYRFVRTQQGRVTHRAPHDAAQHITTSLGGYRDGP